MSNFKFKNLACVLSSMLIFASVPYRVNSMGPGENQSASNLKSRILEAFEKSLHYLRKIITSYWKSHYILEEKKNLK